MTRRLPDGAAIGIVASVPAFVACLWLADRWWWRGVELPPPERPDAVAMTAWMTRH